jgi:hypothetical protein
MTKKKTIKPKKTVAKKIKSEKPQEKEVFLANGKIEQDYDLAKDIEDILNAPRNPFGVESLASLEEKLSSMNIREMQEMAVNASVFPSGNKTTLKNKLKKEFKTKFGSLNRPLHNSQVEKPIVDPDSSVAKDIIDILNGK